MADFAWGLLMHFIQCREGRMTDGKMPKNPGTSIPRPADRSLESYQHCLRGLAHDLGGHDDMTDAQWSKPGANSGLRRRRSKLD